MAKTVGGSTSRTKSKIFCDIESMPIITKSPYEGNESAEVGEAVFDDIKSLLIPMNNGSSSSEGAADNGSSSTSTSTSITILPEAARYFGQRLARSVVDAHDQIGKSGMVFSPIWQEGKIRGVQCGWIPKPILLLCLHEQRFTRAHEAVLQGMIKDLGASKIVGDALKEWNLEGDYLELSSNYCHTFMYTGRKQQCYKCEIFVARAYRCGKALKRTSVDQSTMKKIRACLAIMNSHVKVNKRKVQEMAEELQEEKQHKQLKEEAKQARKRAEAAAAAASSKVTKPKPPQPPPKQPLPVLQPSPSSSSTESNASNASKSSISNLAGIAASSSSKRPRPQVLPARITAAASTTTSGADENESCKKRRKEREESLTVLLGVFEQQYKKMGETLKVLRLKIHDNKEATALELRNEIRAELMEEMRLNTNTTTTKNGTNNHKHNNKK